MPMPSFQPSYQPPPMPEPAPAPPPQYAPPPQGGGGGDFGKFVISDDEAYGASLSPEDSSALEAQPDTGAPRRAAPVQVAPEPGFFDKYGKFIAIGGGIVCLGFVALAVAESRRQQQQPQQPTT